jgi:predicted N-acetyltransferase YhbS
MPSSFVELDASAAEEAAGLARRIGWNDTTADWITLTSCASVIGLHDDIGRLVATGALVPFGPVGCIAKMLVDEVHRGRGIARRLLDRLLAEDAARSAVIGLVATKLGEPVYVRAGFREVGRVNVLRGRLRSTRTGVETATRADFDAIVALDRRAFGADRSRMLRARFAQASVANVARGSDGLRGFALGTAQSGVIVVGPVIAVDVETAVALGWYGRADRSPGCAVDLRARPRRPRAIGRGHPAGDDPRRSPAAG